MSMPSNSATENVYKVIETGLWAIFEANANFVATVAAHNRIKHNVNAQPDPSESVRLTSDLPAVRIIPSGWRRDARGSNMVAVVQSYTLQVFTGDQRTSWYYNDVKLAAQLVVLKTMRVAPAWSMPTGTTLQKIEMDSGTDEMTDVPMEAVTQQGWQSAMTINVHFSFDVLAVTS